jgi:hypothetical protein
MTARLPPPLLTIAQAVNVAREQGQEMTPKQLRAWLARHRVRYPELVQGSPRKWLIQTASLNLALGRDAMGISDLVLETAARVDGHDLRLKRLEQRLAG